MVVHGLTPELVPPYPAKPGFSECLCLHNAYFIINQIICQPNAEIGNFIASISPDTLFLTPASIGNPPLDCFTAKLLIISI